MTDKCPGPKTHAHISHLGKVYSKAGTPVAIWTICGFCVANGCATGLTLTECSKCDCGRADCLPLFSCNCSRDHPRAVYKTCGTCNPKRVTCGCGMVHYGIEKHECGECHMPLKTDNKFCDYCAYTKNVRACGKPL